MIKACLESFSWLTSLLNLFLKIFQVRNKPCSCRVLFCLRHRHQLVNQFLHEGWEFEGVERLLDAADYSSAQVYCMLISLNINIIQKIFCSSVSQSCLIGNWGFTAWVKFMHFDWTSSCWDMWISGLNTPQNTTDQTDFRQILSLTQIPYIDDLFWRENNAH